MTILTRLGIPTDSLGDAVDAELSKAYTAELRAAAVSTEALKAHVERWLALWKIGGNLVDTWSQERPDAVLEMDGRIATGDYDPSEALRCITETMKLPEGLPCEHAESGLCPGMEIRMPYALTSAFVSARYWGVPEVVAMHQLYCPDPHDDCF